jgi:hypothetical protein
LVGWLVWLVGWVGWLVWLVSWIVCLVGWLVSLVVWLVGLVGWLVGWLDEWMERNALHTVKLKSHTQVPVHKFAIPNFGVVQIKLTVVLVSCNSCFRCDDRRATSELEEDQRVLYSWNVHTAAVTLRLNRNCRIFLIYILKDGLSGTRTKSNTRRVVHSQNG